MVFYRRLIDQYNFPLQYTRNWILHGADEYGDGPLFIQPPVLAELKPEEPPAQITMDLPEAHPATPIPQQKEDITFTAIPDTFGFELVDALSEKDD